MKLTDGKKVYEIKMEILQGENWINVTKNILMEQVFTEKQKDELLAGSNIYRVSEEFIKGLREYLAEWEEEYEDWAGDKYAEMKEIGTYEELKKEWE